MCEFCKKVRDSNESLIWDEDKNGELRGYVEIRYKHDRFELWSGNCFTEINYCPMCGRKLTGEENEVEIDKYFEELLDEAKKLNDRHKSDCITINQLNVTIDALVNKLARLREVHGL